MPFIDKIILIFFILSIPLGLGLKNLNNYLEYRTKKDSIEILYSDFNKEYLIDVNDIKESFEKISNIRKTDSVQIGSISSCLTLSHFNRNELIQYNKEVYSNENYATPISEEHQTLIQWCNDYKDYQKDSDPDFFFYNYYFTQGLLHLYGIDNEISINTALYFFLEARKKKPNEEINAYISILKIINNSYPNFSDLSKLIIINEYISKI